MIRFAKYGLWLVPILLVYGIAVMSPSQAWNSVFLLLGVVVGVRQVSGMTSVTQGLGVGRGPVIGLLVKTSSDLVTLLVIQRGFIQGMTELSRGNRLGAVVSLLVVTPLLCILARVLVRTFSRTVMGDR